MSDEYNYYYVYVVNCVNIVLIINIIYDYNTNGECVCVRVT